MCLISLYDLGIITYYYIEKVYYGDHFGDHFGLDYVYRAVLEVRVGSRELAHLVGIRLHTEQIPIKNHVVPTLMVAYGEIQCWVAG